MSELTGVGKVILGALHGRARSGYEIKQLVDRSTRFFWAASYGQIYPELRRLEKAGLVAGESNPSGGRKRRVYRLTAAGREVLHDWLTSPEATHEVRDEGLLKLFFADALAPDEALELVRAMRSRRLGTLEHLRAIEARAPIGDRRVESPLLCLEYGIGLNVWAIDWCDRVEERLAKAAARSRKEART